MLKKSLCIQFLSLFLFLVADVAFGNPVFAAQDDQASIAASAGAEAVKQEKADSGSTAASGTVKEIEKKTEETKEIIEEEVQKVEEVKKEAEKAIVEKKVLEQEALLKQQEAEVTKKEAEVLKKEARVTKDPAAAQKAKELTAQAKKLEKEAEVQQDKAVIAKSKAELAEQTLAASQIRIDKLQKELTDLKLQKAGKRHWLEKLTTAGIVVIVGLFLLLLLGFGIKKFEHFVTAREGDVIRESESALRIKTLNKLFQWLGTMIILFSVVYTIFDVYGISLAPLLASVSIAGIAFGFGGQYLIRDVINGIFILVEGQYRINDVVKIGDVAGLVEAINLRITTLRDLSGRVIVIPNGEVKTVINFTREYSQALFDIGVAYKENVDRVIGVIKEVGAEMRKDPYFKKLILNDLEMFGVDDFGNSQVTIKFRIKTLPIKQWEVSREFRRRLKNRFDELGIEIPFPHRTLYWGAGQENEWMRSFAAGQASKEGPAS